MAVTRDTRVKLVRAILPAKNEALSLENTLPRNESLENLGTQPGPTGEQDPKLIRKALWEKIVCITPAY